ncbi:MAG: X-Pro dipeptidyl-peptidase family [Frankiaceae bacterium]|jgi:predicted acyl esterase|nr:X-Pro dipeptidyl-peptidase family [Frankiaceae bacterium]
MPKIPTFRNVVLLSALVAGLTGVPLTGASAHPTPGGWTSTDYPVNATDGTPLKIRVLKPNATPPSGGWPLVLYYAGSGTTRCHDINWYPRATMVADGFVVLSVNPRGMPRAAAANNAPALGCDSTNTEITDSINDSGADFAGPVDVQDAKDLISWAVTNAATLSINTGKIGAIGTSYHGGLVLHLARSDSRVKGVVADAISGILTPLSTVANISSHPLAEPAGLPGGVAQTTIGWNTHSRPEVVTHMTEAMRGTYLTSTVASATRTWWNDRAIVDDDPLVDKAHLITTPTFVSHGFLDQGLNPQMSTELWKKLPVQTPNKKYLYVGACGHSAACASTNATNLRDKVHQFLDKWVRQDVVTMTGPVFYAVPTKNQATDPWTLQEDTTWPPATSGTVTNWFRAGGVLSPSAPTGAEAATTSYTNPVWVDPQSNICAATTYATGEYKTFNSGLITADGKLIQTDFDLVTSSTTTRQQVFVDMFEVTAGGIETRIWAGLTPVTAIVPTARGLAANTRVHFSFKNGSGYTFTGGIGNTIRIKVASNAKGFFAVEPLSGTDIYSLYHNPNNVNEQSKVTWHLAA